MTVDWTARLEALLGRAGPDGVPATAAEKEAFIAFTLVQAIRQARPTSLSPVVLEFLGTLTTAAGVLESDPAPVLVEKLDAHLQKNMPPAWMLGAYQQLVREASDLGAEAEAGAAFANFCAERPPGAAAVLGGGERPAGTTPGGMARLAFIPKKK